MIKTITCCDGCSEELEHTRDKYYLNLKTDKFWNSVENDYRIERLVFCEQCAKQIKESLSRIAEKED